MFVTKGCMLPSVLGRSGRSPQTVVDRDEECALSETLKTLFREIEEQKENLE